MRISPPAGSMATASRVARRSAHGVPGGSPWRHTGCSAGTCEASASSAGTPPRTNVASSSRRASVPGCCAGWVSLPERRVDEEVVGVDEPAVRIGLHDRDPAGRHLDRDDGRLLVAGGGDRDARRRGGAAALEQVERRLCVVAALEDQSQQDVDGDPVRAAVLRAREEVQAAGDTGAVAAQLGQDAGLGGRREPLLAAMDGPDHGCAREVRMPVPGLRQRGARPVARGR